MGDRLLDRRITLTGGVDMPVLGLGTYKSSDHEVASAVASALALGYRSVDTASFYGNERGVGEGLRLSGIPREEIFVTTKVWNDQQGFASTVNALESSLALMGLDHVDLYLVHWPIRASLEPTWRAMEELLSRGLTRAIGVCNFLPSQLETLLAIADVPPAVDQVEFHPWLQQPGLQGYLAQQGIVLEAWAPVMRGHAEEEPVLADIARAHGVTAAQVALRWALQLGHVVIPKSVHAERIEENADLDGFELDETEMAAIATCDRASRFGPDPLTFVW